MCDLCHRDHVVFCVTPRGLVSCGNAVIRSFAAAYGTRVIFSSASLLWMGLCGTGAATPSIARHAQPPIVIGSGSNHSVWCLIHQRPFDETLSLRFESSIVE